VKQISNLYRRHLLVKLRLTAPNVVAALILTTAPFALAQTSPEASVAGTFADRNRGNYVLGQDDQITLHVPNAPDLSEKPFRIEANGQVKLPMIGRIQAGGLTVDQLETEVAKRLGEFLEQPEVTISITEFRSEPVSIIGAVATPGMHQIEGSKTLLEMVAVAGGLRPDAGPTIKITRQLNQGRIPVPGAADDSSGKFSVAEIDLKDVTEARKPEYNIIIKPHDVLSVPRAESVYVIGEVTHAGSLSLSESPSMSVLEAVSSSGGLLRTAAPNHAMILRLAEGQSRRNEIPVDVKRIMAGKSSDTHLLGGDVLVIPGSTGKRAALRTLEAAVQAGTIFATYGAIH
jgi:polysaccharide export outer membrane protein